MSQAGVRRRFAAAVAVAALVLVAPAPAAPAADDRRVLLPRVHAAEGFNLRRDTFLRAALVARRLGPPWFLALAPIPRMPHWRAADDPGGRASRWSTYFDIASLAAATPVVDWSVEAGEGPLRADEAWVMLDAPMSEQTVFEDAPCDGEAAASAWRRDGDHWTLPAAPGERPVVAGALECRRVFAPSSALVVELKKTRARTVLVDRFERLFWDPAEYDSAAWWEVRRSLRFAARLVEEAARWRRATFGDERYVAIHWRRGDYVATGRAVASAAEVAAEAWRLRGALGVKRVFVATDAGDDDLRELRARLEFERYAPPDGSWLDGEVAIVDQLLAAGAVHFVGTASSTFSTVIMEERELAGLPPASTWNVLCPAGAAACAQPSPRRPPASR